MHACEEINLYSCSGDKDAVHAQNLPSAWHNCKNIRGIAAGAITIGI